MTAPTRPKMTAAEATAFEQMSEASYRQIAAQLDCACEPYADVFTYVRWTAQGQQVRKGEHGKKLATYIAIAPRKDDPEGKTKLRPRTISVFCRCQVTEREA